MGASWQVAEIKLKENRLELYSSSHSNPFIYPVASPSLAAREETLPQQLIFLCFHFVMFEGHG